MATVTATKFKAIAPEFEALIGTPRYTDVIACAQLSVNDTVWKSKAELGLIYLAAHMLTIGDRKGSGGPLKRERVDKLEREYAVDVSDDSLKSTSYGLEFLRIRKSLVRPFYGIC